MNKAMTTFDIEFRSTQDEEKMTVEGYALKFETPTLLREWSDGSKTFEQIERGALDGTDVSNVVLNKNHDDNLLLARTINKSLELIVDDIGLKIKATLPNTQLGRDVFEEIRTGLLSKMSFRWTGGDRSVDYFDNGDTMVHWKSLGTLYDVSAVAFPAYDDTSIAELRSLRKPTENGKAVKESRNENIRTQILRRLYEV